MIYSHQVIVQVAQIVLLTLLIDKCPSVEIIFKSFLLCQEKFLITIHLCLLLKFLSKHLN